VDLSYDVISQFAKVVNKDKKHNTETTVRGTIVEENGIKYVKLAGSDQLTPLADTDLQVDFMTATAKHDDRVLVLIKDHTATVTGNLSAPAASTDDIETFNKDVIDQLNANSAYIEKLQADKADIGELEAAEAKITKLETEKASIKDLDATNANIENLDTAFANIDFTNIGKAAMEYFYSQSGLIKNVIVGDQTITGNLVGVTISGDLIEGNTVKADKLVIKGNDGLYYKLNTDGVKIEAQQTDQNSINGSVIKAKSITATKISVSDLVAFDATIGGFNITDGSLYSGVKESVNNTTRGIYLGKDGQMAIGDANNYFKYYKDTDGSYKIAISAVDNMEIGGRNLILRSADYYAVGKQYKHWSLYGTAEYVEDYKDNFHAAHATGQWSGIGIYLNPFVGDVNAGDNVTFSATVKNDLNVNAEVIFYLMQFNGNGERVYVADIHSKSLGVLVAGETKRLTYTHKIEPAIIDLMNSGGTARMTMQVVNANDNNAYFYAPKLEKGNKPTDWSPAPEDVQNGIDDASKTATNFLSFNSTWGLEVGNRINGAWSGFRAQIRSAAFNILAESGTVIASYGAKLIELGKSATDAVIKFCGGKGQINYDDTDDCLQLTADNVRLKGTEMASLYSNYTDSNGTFRNGAVHASPGNVQITAGGGSDNSNVHVNPTNIQMSAKNFYLSGALNDSTNGGEYVSVTKGSSGIWTYKKYSNGDLEMWGSYAVSNMACDTAMGTMYRTAVFSPSAFPFTVYNPHLTASYESDGYGAFLWATTTTTTAKPPNYYLVRPTSTTIANGKIVFKVSGKWKQ